MLILVICHQGKILIWRHLENKIVIKKKFSEDQVTTILNLRNENHNISQKDFLKQLELENDIKLSITTLKKMIDNVY